MNFEEFDKLSLEEKVRQLDQWRLDQAIDNLIMTLEDQNFEISGKASEYLVSIGKPAVSKLVKATKSYNVDIRSWAVVTLGHIGNIGIYPFLILLKIAIKDHNLIVRNKAEQAIWDTLQVFIKYLKRIFELLSYYVFISIVQMVCLIFLIAPIIVFFGKLIPEEYSPYQDFISVLLLASTIPILSGFVASYLFKGKEPNFPLAALVGVLQIIPYNFLLAFLIQKINIINCFVPVFGLLGGVLGHKFYLNETKRKYEERESYEAIIDPDTAVQRTILFLIFQRLKLSKKLQDSIIIFSSIIGIILLIFISISIYNISSLSTNKRLFDIRQYQETFPFGKSSKSNLNF